VSRQLLEWCLWNALFATALVAGILFEVVWIGWCVAAFVWLMLLMHLFVLLVGTSKPLADPVPWAIARTFDAGVIAFTAAFAWYATAAGYAAAMAIQGLIYLRGAESGDD